MMRNVVSVSGGKDSTALWLLALERDADPIVVFADTGHEHPQTYEYLDYLEKAVGPIKRVAADFTGRLKTRRDNLAKSWEDLNLPEGKLAEVRSLLQPTGVPFLDLCLLKGRFPSTRARFCSQELKHEPIRTQVVERYLADGDLVVSWQGVRADESGPRAKLDIVEQHEECLIAYRPIITWSVADVFAMHRKHGIDWNPLYEQGMGRVGCMPCIHARKGEIREIAERFPAEIERVREWERLVAAVSRLGLASFFGSDKTTRDYRQDESITIDRVVQWSKTSRGGNQYELPTGEDSALCSSIYGLCEAAL